MGSEKYHYIMLCNRNKVYIIVNVNIYKMCTCVAIVNITGFNLVSIYLYVDGLLQVETRIIINSYTNGIGGGNLLKLYQITT